MTTGPRENEARPRDGARRDGARPPEWEPLVSARQWLILAHALRDAPATLADLRVLLCELSPGVRRALLAHLMQALAGGAAPLRAVWRSLALTGHDVTLRAAVERARLDSERDARPATVHALPGARPR